MSFNVKKYVAAYITIALVAFGLGAWVDMPVLAQQPVCPAVVPVCGGGSGGGIAAGTTAITGGTDTRVIFNDGGVWGEDAGFTYAKVTDTATLGTLVVGAGTISAPSVAVGATNQGWYNRAATRLTAASGSAATWEVDSSGTYTSSTGVHFFLSGALGTGSDLSLVRQGVGVLRVGDGSTGYGWVAQHGELGLNADYTNATTTFSSTNLSVSLVSGRTYSFSLVLLMSDSVAADGMKLDFNGGAATITNFRVNCAATNDTTGASVNFTAATSTTLAGVLNIATMASTGTHMVTCNGTIVPSSSSTFIVRAAQNAHTTGTLTIYRGSFMNINDVRPL